MNWPKVFFVICFGLILTLPGEDGTELMSAITFHGTCESLTTCPCISAKELKDIVGIARRGRSGNLFVTLVNVSEKTYVIRGPQFQIRTFVAFEDVDGHLDCLNPSYTIPLWEEVIVLSPSQTITYSITLPRKVGKILMIILDADCLPLPLKAASFEELGKHAVRIAVILKKGKADLPLTFGEKFACWDEGVFDTRPNDVDIFWSVAERHSKTLSLWLILRKPGKSLVRFYREGIPVALEYLDGKALTHKVISRCKNGGCPARLRYLEKNTSAMELYPCTSESFDFDVELPDDCQKLVKATVEVQFLEPNQLRNHTWTEVEKIIEATKVHVDVDLKRLNPGDTAILTDPLESKR